MASWIRESGMNRQWKPAAIHEAVATGPSTPGNRTLMADVVRQFCRHKGGVSGAIVLLIIILIVAFGPLLHSVDPQMVNVRARNLPSSLAHPLGTDNLGRDMLAAILVGGRTSLAVGLVAMLIALGLGTLVGLVSGYVRALDGVLMRLTDLFLALPLLPLLLLAIMLFRDTLRAAFGPEAGIFILVVLVIGATSWMKTARIVRSSVLSVKEREYVLAAESIGVSSIRIMIRHILPNVMSPIIVSASLGIANAIMVESALSFLGLGFPSDYPTWGRLLYDGINYLAISPSRAIWPGVAISLTLLSINYVGDALRDALDPKMRSR